MSFHKPDQRYLRVRNLSTSDLYLADLDDEENDEQNEHIQTYVEAGSHVDLPMTNRVVESYEQGTIRGFIDSGDLAAAPHEGVKAELWVGPNGDDDNPGTRNNPLASIQTAIDRLDDEYDRDTVKNVFLLPHPSNYSENVIANVPNLHIRGTGQRSEDTTVLPEDPSYPALMVTNLTQSGVEQFRADGGVSYSFSSPNTYSYDGPDLDGRDVRSDLPSGDINLRVENVTFQDGQNTTVEVLSVPHNGTNNYQLDFIKLINCVVGTTESGATGLFAKNINRLQLQNSYFYSVANAFVADTFDALHFKGGSDDNLGNLGRIHNEISGAAIFRGRGDVTAAEGGTGARNDLYNPSTFSGAGSVYVFGDLANHYSVNVKENTYLMAGRGETLYVYPDSEFSVSNLRLMIRCQTFDGGGIGTIYAKSLQCEDGSYSGSGALEVQSLRVMNGNFTISNGTGHVIRGGYVDGNLTINGGTDVELRGVTVAGDLIVDDDNTSATLEGCHVEGTLDVDSDNINVTVSGGTIMNANDPGGNITTETTFYG